MIDFDNKPGINRFLAVRELKLTGLRTPNYNRRADLVCFVNGLPLVFIELKAVYKNIRAGFDGNLRDYMDENVIAHAFHHNAFLIVSNGDHARYGSITSEWEHFAEWKRLDEKDKGTVAAEVLLNGMLAHDRLLDIVENYILFDESKAGATRKVVAPQSSGVGRQPRSGVGREAGGSEARVPARETASASGHRVAARNGAQSPRRSGVQLRRKRGMPGLAVLRSGRPGEHHRARAPGLGTARRFLAHARAAARATRWPSSQRRCAGRFRATSPSC